MSVQEKIKVVIETLRAKSRPRLDRQDRESLAAVLDSVLALLSETAFTEHRQFADCIRNLVNGSAFDLTDSPKSFISNVRRLVGQLDEAMRATPTERE